MSRLVMAGGIGLAAMVSLAAPAQAYWYPAPYGYGYHRPIYYGPRYVPVVPYYRPRVVYVPPPFYAAPPLQFYPAPYAVPVPRRAIRAAVRLPSRPAAVAVPAAPPCNCTASDPSPFAGPGRIDSATPVATLPAPLPTLGLSNPSLSSMGAPTLPAPARPAAPSSQPVDIPDFPTFNAE